MWRNDRGLNYSCREQTALITMPNNTWFDHIVCDLSAALTSRSILYSSHSWLGWVLYKSLTRKAGNYRLSEPGWQSFSNPRRAISCWAGNACKWCRQLSEFYHAIHSPLNACIKLKVWHCGRSSVFSRCWANVVDVGSTSTQHWDNMSPGITSHTPTSPLGGTFVEPAIIFLSQVSQFLNPDHKFSCHDPRLFCTKHR